MGPSARTSLVQLPAFNDYQAGKIPFDHYLSELSLFAGCAYADALKIHNGIIVREYDHVGQLVDELRTRGYRLGCLSNTNGPHWMHLVETGAYPTIQSLEMKMASHLVGLNKPDPRIYELFCSTFHLEPAQIVFFDDHAVNVAAANSLGWTANLIRPGDDTADQMRAHLARLGMLPALP
jgi:FMN phosphatase YigB (HAD superfamily)